MRSTAYLEGSVLYIDGRIQGVDFSPAEAVEYIESLQYDPRAPSGVRIFSRPRSRRRKMINGWPETEPLNTVRLNVVGTGWPDLT